MQPKQSKPSLPALKHSKRPVSAKIHLQNKFFLAVFSRNFNVISECLQKGVNPNAYNDQGVTALHIVAENGDVLLGIKLLDCRDINTNLRTIPYGYTPLVLACLFAKEKFANLMLRRGVNPNVPSKMSKTPLHISARIGCHRILNELISHNVNVNVVDAFGNTPLNCAINDNHDVYMTTQLIKAGANLVSELPAENLHSFLELVLNCNSLSTVDFVEYLLSCEMDINFIDSKSGRNCLHYVAITGYLPLAEVLVERGINIDHKDISGRTPLMVAKDHGNEKVYEYLKTETTRNSFYYY